VDRTLLTAGLALGLGAMLGLGLACRIPDTLGLACEIDAHCDGDQVCRAGICAQPGDGTTGAPTTSGDVQVTTSGVIETSSSGPGPDTTSSTGGAGGSTGSTGEACGVGTCTDLDAIVVLDNSDSMYQWLLPLANSLNSLVSQIAERFGQVCSFHVAIVTGDPTPSDNTPECQIPGAMIQIPESCSARLAGDPWIGSETTDVDAAVEIARCTLIQAGAGGPDDEIMLQTMVAALDPAMSDPGACNAGFRRPDANLLLLYISDEDDSTPQSDLPELAEAFEAWTSGPDTAFIGLVADDNRECPWDPDGTDSDGSGAQVPSKLNGFLALTTIPLTQQSSVDICETVAYDFEAAFGAVDATCGR
jgi:hypothetical protein